MRKIGKILLASSLAFTLSGYFNDGPDDVVKKYYDSIQSGEINELSETMSIDAYEKFSNGIVGICSFASKKDQKIFFQKAKDKGIEAKYFYFLNYKNAPKEAQDFVLKTYYEYISKQDKGFEYKILNSEVSEKSAKIKVELSKDGKIINRQIMNLKKFNDEWKIISGF